MTDKEKFLDSWTGLISNFENIVKVADANRRLLAGLTTLLISKEIVTPDEVKKLEKDVSKGMKKRRKNNV